MGAERALFLADDLLGNAVQRQVMKAAGGKLAQEALELGAKESLEIAGKRIAGEAAETMARGAAGAGEKQVASKLAGSADDILSVNRRNYLGGGDEGKVFSNGDGTITKVFHSTDHDARATANMYTELDAMGIRLPKITGIGKTAEGNPALRMTQIGDGDHLQTQLMLRQVPRAEMPALQAQYDDFGRILTQNNVRIDWQLKNMRWQDGKLYVLDPSFMKRGETIGEGLLAHMRPR
jgi:hypothetical protein